MRADGEAFVVMPARNVSDMAQEDGIGQGEKTGPQLRVAD